MTGYEECQECHAMIWSESSALHAEWHQRIRDAVRDLGHAINIIAGGVS